MPGLGEKEAKTEERRSRDTDKKEEEIENELEYT